MSIQIHFVIEIIYQNHVLDTLPLLSTVNVVIYSKSNLRILVVTVLNLTLTIYFWPMMTRLDSMTVAEMFDATDSALVSTSMRIIMLIF